MATPNDSGSSTLPLHRPFMIGWASTKAAFLPGIQLKGEWLQWAFE